MEVYYLLIMNLEQIKLIFHPSTAAAKAEAKAEWEAYCYTTKTKMGKR